MICWWFIHFPHNKCIYNSQIYYVIEDSVPPFHWTSPTGIAFSKLIKFINTTHNSVATASGHPMSEIVPSSFCRFTMTIVLGLLQEHNIVTGLLSIHLMAATDPFVWYLNSPCWRWFFCFNIWGIPLLFMCKVPTAYTCLACNTFSKLTVVKNKCNNSVGKDWSGQFLHNTLSKSSAIPVTTTLWLAYIDLKFQNVPSLRVCKTPYLVPTFSRFHGQCIAL